MYRTDGLSTRRSVGTSFTSNTRGWQYQQMKSRMYGPKMYIYTSRFVQRREVHMPRVLQLHVRGPTRLTAHRPPCPELGKLMLQLNEVGFSVRRIAECQVRRDEAQTRRELGCDQCGRLAAVSKSIEIRSIHSHSVARWAYSRGVRADDALHCHAKAQSLEHIKVRGGWAACDVKSLRWDARTMMTG